MRSAYQGQNLCWEGCLVQLGQEELPSARVLAQDLAHLRLVRAEGLLPQKRSFRPEAWPFYALVRARAWPGQQSLSAQLLPA